jgi:predicted Zn finger-like uncharacterized protein
MPIAVTCSECNSTYRVSDDAAGKAIKCKKCGARVAVPAAEAAGDDDLNVNEPSATPGKRAASAEKKAGSNKTLLIAGAAVLAFGCCCVAPTGGYFGTAYFSGMWPFVPPISKAKDAAAKSKEGDKRDQDKADGLGKEAVAKPGNKVLLDRKDTLRLLDPKVARPIKPPGQKKPAKEYRVTLEQGKTYVIDMKADLKTPLPKDPNIIITPANAPHDPFLILLDPKRREVAFNDDIVDLIDLDAQIRYTPAVTGEYTIQATVESIVPQNGMGFTLTVRQE